MNDLWSYAVVIALLLCCVGAALHSSCFAGEFPLACTTDYKSPIPPDLLKKASIQTVYVYVGFPLKPDPASGRRVLDEKIKPQLDEFFKLYGDNGIKVLLVSGFYTRPPKGTEAVDASGRTMTIACLRNPDFLTAMKKEIQDLAEAFATYPAFAGFLFDDGVHVRVDCCYCDLCKRLFKEKHGIEPPPFEPDTGAACLDPNDPRLLWDAFHREAYANYMRTQAQAARTVSDKLLLVTIPSDSYFYGRQLNSEVERDKTPLGGDARLMRMDRTQVRDWHVFQSFPVPGVVNEGPGLRSYATGCHLTEPSPKMILHSDGPLIETAGRQQFMSPAEIARMMRTTIAEGANRICFWNNARALASYPEGMEAVGAVSADVDKIMKVLDERQALPSRVGLLYSTATEIVQQPWRKNTLERWRHLHAFEAMAYALTRRNVQFRVVFDNELDEAALAGLDALILTGVTHMTRPVAEMLEKRMADGKLRVLADPASLAIKGAKGCNFDPDIWFKNQLKGYRQVRYLDQQAEQISRALLPELGAAQLQPVTLSSDTCFAKISQGEQDSLLVFVVNWDVWNGATARVDFAKPYKVKDEVSGQELGSEKTLEMKVEPAGWRVIRCARK